MSFAEIEAELPRLTQDELRDLALKSWLAISEKESKSSDFNECDADDPALLAALDEVRAEMAKWNSK